LTALWGQHQIIGSIHFPQNAETIAPGNNFSIEAEIDTPVAMSKGLCFTVREDGRTVGAGFVSQIIDN